MLFLFCTKVLLTEKGHPYMFEIGKIPPQILERIVLDPVTHSKVHRDDIVVRPKTGEDCSAMHRRGIVCVLHRPYDCVYRLSGGTYTL